jgi:hypothetical protein
VEGERAAEQVLRARAVRAAREYVASRHASAPERKPAPPVQRSRSRERRPTRRRRTARSLSGSRDGPDEPEPRACEVCGESLAGKYSNAKTCDGPCRQRLYRQRLKAKPPAPASSEPAPRKWTEDPPETLEEWQELRDAVARARLERDGGYTRVEREERRRERQAAA